MSSSALRAALAAALLLGAAAAAAAGPEDAAERFRRAFAEKAPAPADERAEAARALGEEASRSAAELLCGGYASVAARLDDLSARRTKGREELTRLLGGHGTDGTTPVPAEVLARIQELKAGEESLREQDEREREVLAALRRALARCAGGKAAGWLAGEAARPSSPRDLRVALLGILGEAGVEAALPQVRAALRDRDPAVREAALAAFARLRARDAEAASVLAAGLGDERWTVRLAAARRLAELATPEAVDLLVPHLAREEGKPRSDVAALLRGLTGQRFGPEPEGWAAWWREHRAEFASGERTLTPGAPGPAAGGEGPEGSANYYGITVESLRILFVIDISGSMERPGGGEEEGPAKVDAAKKELLRCIRTLGPASAFTVFSFRDTVDKWKPALVKADDAAKQGVARWVEGLVAANSTNTYAALEEALKASSANPVHDMGPGYAMAADTIFLLTDGAPTTPGGKLRDGKGNPEWLRVLEAVRGWNRGKRVAIHAIGIGREANAEFLGTLARENGGTYVAVR